MILDWFNGPVLHHRDRGAVQIPLIRMQMWLGVDDQFVEDTELDGQDIADVGDDVAEEATMRAILHCSDVEFEHHSPLPTECIFFSNVDTKRAYALVIGRFDQLFERLAQGHTDRWGL